MSKTAEKNFGGETDYDKQSESIQAALKDPSPKVYDFKIIPNEQTPKVRSISQKDKEDMVAYAKKHQDEFLAFKEWAMKQPTALAVAANQCSLNGKRYMKRVVAMIDRNTGTWHIIIDPQILETEGHQVMKNEGCLTWKGKFIRAMRYLKVKVGYYNINGTYRELRVTGYDAQIWQHEINHLDGVEEDVFDRGPAKAGEKIGRNDPCPCGSGIKYKKCCGKIS